jgi:hypothetical protein
MTRSQFHHFLLGRRSDHPPIKITEISPNHLVNLGLASPILSGHARGARTLQACSRSGVRVVQKKSGSVAAGQTAVGSSIFRRSLGRAYGAMKWS